MNKNPAKSKTIWAGIITMVIGLVIVLYSYHLSPPKSIDDMNKPTGDSKELVVGLSLLGTGGTAIKGRFDADKNK